MLCPLAIRVLLNIELKLDWAPYLLADSVNERERIIFRLVHHPVEKLVHLFTPTRQVNSNLYAHMSVYWHSAYVDLARCCSISLTVLLKK